MAEGGNITEKSIQSGLVQATQVAREAELRQSPNGIRFASFGENTVEPADLERVIQAVPASIAAALHRKTYFFVPLALPEARTAQSDPVPISRRISPDETLIAPAYTTDLADLAICHRNVALDPPAKNNSSEGVFISTRLLSDRFSLAFELFINVAHAFVDETGVPESFSELAWNQALADVRGETSIDAWESRAQALSTPSGPGTAAAQAASSPRIDEKFKTEFVAAAFSDAIAIYTLSLATDFDYSELREREYPLLAPQALAERLRHIARLFPPNPTYEFAVRYRKRP